MPLRVRRIYTTFSVSSVSPAEENSTHHARRVMPSCLLPGAGYSTQPNDSNRSHRRPHHKQVMIFMFGFVCSFGSVIDVVRVASFPVAGKTTEINKSNRGAPQAV